MYEYELAITKNGSFFFKTITAWSTALTIATELKNRFPESEGYALRITKWRKPTGERLCLADLETHIKGS